MTSIGETLRRERLRRNVELGRISKELKISPRLLEAMEADRFDKLPGGVFTKSFVRQYARELGLDEQEIAASLERMLNPPPTVVPEVPEPKPKATVNIALERAFQYARNFLTAEDSRFAWSSSLTAVAIVIVAALFGAAVYSWLQPKPRRVDLVNNTTTPSAAKPPRQAVALPSQSTVAANTAKAPGGPATGTAERLAGAVHVQLTAAAPVWVMVNTDGKHAFSGTLEPNTSRTIDANDRVFVKLGNAGGARFWLNGKPVGPFGQDGEVVQVQFTSGGFQIVPAGAPTPGEGRNASGDSPEAPLDPL